MALKSLEITPLTHTTVGWTLDEWLSFPSDGWKYEIIDGVLHMSPAPTLAHQDASAELVMLMRLHARQNDLGVVLAAPCDVRLPGQSVPVEPDILFVPKSRQDILGTKAVEGAPDLVVEILSPSSGTYDRRTKFDLYQKSGVSEYWLVDYRAQTVTIYHLAQDVYVQSGHYTGDDVAASTVLTGFTVAIASLFTLSR